MAYVKSFICFIILIILQLVSSSNLFDEELYKSVLNNETCRRQLQEINFMEFIDASGIFPQSLYLGGQGSLGNYRQCLSLAQKISNETVYGKYCMIRVAWHKNRTTNLQDTEDLPLELALMELDEINESEKTYEDLRKFKRDLHIMTGKGNLKLQAKGDVGMAICLPRSCSVEDTIGRFADKINLSYTVQYCRLPNDKVFAVVDYFAVIAIIIAGTLILLSTAYDLYQTFLLRKDRAEINALLTCGSVFTNTCRLLTFTTTTASIECLEGIRALSILWVVVGHSVAHTMLYSTVINYKTAYEWAMSKSAIWLVSAVLSVDTFFLMSGLLLVYTVLRKLTPTSLLKNIQWFYLYRLLRMFPLLFTIVFFQASLFHHMGDGPAWPVLAPAVHACRTYWWSTFMHVQNWINPSETCLSQTWYLSVDFQLYLVAPIVLYWVLSNVRSAFYSLSAALLLSFLITTPYCYFKDFTGVSVISMIPDDSKIADFYNNYYVNTFTRSPAFIVGMVFGYLLHIWRASPSRMNKWMVATGWVLSFVIGYCMIYCIYPGAHLPSSSINFLNAFMRPLWAMSVGWLVLACSVGYGGPINWFLSLTMWKFVSRVSYSLYLVHLPIQLILRGQDDTAVMFSVQNLFNTLFADLALSLMAATVLCILVDAPFSTIQKFMVPSSWLRPPMPPPAAEEVEVEVEIDPESDSLVDNPHE